MKTMRATKTKRISKQYSEAIEQANINLADARARGEDAIGVNAVQLIEKYLTPEEIAASDLRVSMMIELANARAERGITQRKLEELSGVKQPVIARMEKGNTSPQLDTFLKVLAPLGKTLCICDLPKTKV